MCDFRRFFSLKRRDFFSLSLASERRKDVFERRERKKEEQERNRKQPRHKQQRQERHQRTARFFDHDF
jgi:hypothetical protein